MPRTKRPSQFDTVRFCDTCGDSGGWTVFFCDLCRLWFCGWAHWDGHRASHLL